MRRRDCPGISRCPCQVCINLWLGSPSRGHGPCLIILPREKSDHSHPIAILAFFTALHAHHRSCFVTSSCLLILLGASAPSSILGEPSMSRLIWQMHWR